MKLEVGDKVRIKSKDWYEKNKDPYGDVSRSGSYSFTDNMSKFCGKVVEITEILEDSPYAYKINLDSGLYVWEDYMFEYILSSTDDLVPIKFGEFYVIFDNYNMEVTDIELYSTREDAKRAIESRRRG